MKSEKGVTLSMGYSTVVLKAEIKLSEVQALTFFTDSVLFESKLSLNSVKNTTVQMEARHQPFKKRSDFFYFCLLELRT